MKKTYQIKGTEIKMTSSRDYTHAVCLVNSDDTILATRSLCGSLFLAQKEANSESNKHKEMLANGSKMEIKELEVIK